MCQTGGCKKLWYFKWWVMGDEWWVMSDENWVMNDEWWVTIFLNQTRPERFYVCILHFVGPMLQCIKINAQLFPAEMKDEISLNAPFQWKLGVCVYCSLCSSSFFVFFTNQTQNMTIHVLETQQTHQPTSDQNSETKTIWIKPMWKKKIKPMWKKKSNPSNPATDQMIKPNKCNWSNGSTQQMEPIKASKPTADQPIHHHRVPKSSPSNPLSINPSNLMCMKYIQ